MGRAGRPDRCRRGPAADRTRPGRRREPVRHRRRLLRRTSEEILGKALGADREDVLIATKVADADGRRPERRRAVPASHHPWRARRACAGSAPTTSTCTRCTSGTGRRRWRRRCAALDTWCESGKVRYIGCSNYAGWQLMKALGDLGPARLQALRQPAGLLLAAGARHRVRDRAARGRPGPGHPGVEPARRRPAVRQVPPRREAPAGSRHLTEWDEPPVHDEDKLYDTIEVLVAIGRIMASPRPRSPWRTRWPSRR